MLAMAKGVLLVKIRHKRIRRKKGNWDLEVHHGLQEFVLSLKSDIKFCVPYFLGKSPSLASGSQTLYLTLQRLQIKDPAAPRIG